MPADIFISFASKDVKIASTLCSALESRGFSCWISARDIMPGENFQVSIVHALRQVKIMLLVFTANSNASEEMTKELALASQQKLIVIPLRVEDVAPSDAFAYEFATRQWIDVFADWEASIDQLSRRIAQTLAAHEADAPPPPLADGPADRAIRDPQAAIGPAPRAVLDEPAAFVASTADAHPAPAANLHADFPEAPPAPNNAMFPRMALLAAAVAVIAAIGVAAPRLFQDKARPDPRVAVAVVPPPAPAALQAPVATPATPVAETPEVAEAEPAARPTSKPAPRRAAPQVDIPY